MRIVGYCRVATKDQAKLQTQKDDIMRYAKENGYDIISIISDSGVSGIQNVAGMEHLLCLAQRGDIDAILCTEPSRISRDTEQYLEWLEAMHSTGVKLEFVKEPHRLSDECMHRLNSVKLKPDCLNCPMSFSLGAQEPFNDGSVEEYDRLVCALKRRIVEENACCNEHPDYLWRK